MDYVLSFMRRLRIILLLIASACAFEEDVILKDSGKRTIIVFGTITPGDSLFVQASYSALLNEWSGHASNYISDANVKISNAEGEEITLLFDPVKKLYVGTQLIFKIIEGREYELSVKVSGQNDIIARCKVPLSYANWTELNKETVFEDGLPLYKISGGWIDAEERPRFNVFITTRDTDAYSRKFDAKPWEIRKIDNHYFFERTLGTGGLIQADFSLITMDEHLYAFHVATIPYKEFIDLSRSDIINSFKGVFPSYSNVEGGAGVFGAYLKDTRTVAF